MIGHVRPTAASTSSKRKQDGSFQDWSKAFHDPGGSWIVLPDSTDTRTVRSSLRVAPRQINSLSADGDPDSGRLNVRQILVNGSHGIRCLEGINSADVSSDGRFLYTVAGYQLGTGAVGVFEIRSTGKIELIQQFLYRDPGLERFNGGHSIVVSPDGRRVYATATMLRAIACFEARPDMRTTAPIGLHPRKCDRSRETPRSNRRRRPSEQPIRLRRLPDARVDCHL